MRFLRRSLTGLFLMALAIGALTLAAGTLVEAFRARYAEGAPTPPAPERRITTAVVPVRAETVTPVIAAFGAVVSRRTLEVRAPASGVIAELAPDFADGAAVAAGQLLLRLDPADATTARDLAASAVAAAEAEIARADRAAALARDVVAAAEVQAGLRQKALERQQTLGERGVGTEAALEEAELAGSAADQAVLAARAALASDEAAATSARTALAEAKINLAEAGRRLADTEVRADFAGTLGNVAVVAGGRVVTAERLADIVDPADLEVSFRVSTADYVHLLDASGRLVAAPVAVALAEAPLGQGSLPPAAEGVVRGTLARVGASVGEGQSGRLLYARLDDPRGLRPGDFVAVRIAEPSLDGVARVPAAAVDAGGTVLVLGPDDRLGSVPVDVLRRERDAVIVRAGDLAGREIVATRAPRLGPGIAVNPTRDPSDRVALAPDRRAALLAYVERASFEPAERDRIRADLASDLVPSATVAELDARMGG